MDAWKALDRLDGCRDEPPKDSDAIRAELDRLEGLAAAEWYAKREPPEPSPDAYNGSPERPKRQG